MQTCLYLNVYIYIQYTITKDKFEYKKRNNVKNTINVSNNDYLLKTHFNK